MKAFCHQWPKHRERETGREEKIPHQGREWTLIHMTPIFWAIKSTSNLFYFIGCFTSSLNIYFYNSHHYNRNRTLGKGLGKPMTILRLWTYLLIDCQRRQLCVFRYTGYNKPKYCICLEGTHHKLSKNIKNLHNFFYNTSSIICDNYK